jgi:hypothetical protein
MIIVAMVVVMLDLVDVAFIPAMDMMVIPLSGKDIICHIGTRAEKKLLI